MNFGSIKEYFYRVQGYCFLVMLIPLSLQLLIHFKILFANSSSAVVIVNEEVANITLFVLLVVVLTIVHWYSKRRLLSISKKFGLGIKLDDYFILTLVRVSAGVVICFVTISVYVVTQFDSLNILFFLSFGWIFFQVPTSRKACKELKLRGDEREMVFYKKDKF